MKVREGRDMDDGKKRLLNRASVGLVIVGAATAAFGCIAAVTGIGTHVYAGEAVTLGPLMVGCGAIQVVPGIVGYFWDRAHTDDGFKPTLTRGIVAAVVAFGAVAIDLGIFGVLRSVCFDYIAALAGATPVFHTVALASFVICIVSLALIVLFMAGIILTMRDDVALMDGE